MLDIRSQKLLLSVIFIWDLELKITCQIVFFFFFLLVL